MPTEVSIAKPLSGPETIDAMFAAIREVLRKDDRFGSHMAYPGFRAVLSLNFYPHQSYIPDVVRTIEVSAGEMGVEGDSVQVDVEMAVRPPNQVREEAGMPQPVLVTDGKGNQEEKWVKRVKQPAGTKIPKNVVKGI